MKSKKHRKLYSVMEYLHAALSLRSLIKETNHFFLENTQKLRNSPRRMRVVSVEESVKELIMDDFSNEDVRSNLKELDETKAFVVSDIASMEVSGKN